MGSMGRNRKLNFEGLISSGLFINTLLQNLPLGFLSQQSDILTTPVEKSFLQMCANYDIILISRRRYGNGKRSDKEYFRGNFR